MKMIYPILGLTVLIATGCMKKDDQNQEPIIDTNSNFAESALAIANGNAAAAESASLISLSTPATQCTYGTETSGTRKVRGTCAGAVSPVSWSGCYVASVAMSGSWTETFDNSTTCSNLNGGAALSGAESVTRTTTDSSMVYRGGAKVVLSTADHQNFQNTTLTGAIAISGGATKTITIGSLRRTLYGEKGGVVFDHSFTGALTVTGTRASGTREVAGTLNGAHNGGRYTGAHVFTGVKWNDANCYFPTAGQIDSTYTYSDASTRTSTLLFSSECERARFTNVDGRQTIITLTMTE